MHAIDKMFSNSSTQQKNIVNSDACNRLNVFK